MHNAYPAYACNVPSAKYNLLLLLLMLQHIYDLGQFYTTGMKDMHTLTLLWMTGMQYYYL